MQRGQSGGAGNTFTYKALSIGDRIPRIRLLHLPGLSRGNGPLKYTLSVHDLDSAPPYSALSYTWGLEPASELISLNGEAAPIRPALAGALKELVQSAQPRCLWVDALCIDQNNVLERNEQVRIMARIYKEAQRVFVWFGDEDDTSDVLMQPGLAQRLPEHIRKASAEEAASITTSLCQFTQRAWWDRMWVVQEHLFAKSTIAVCGTKMVDWWVLAANLKAGIEFLEGSYTIAFPHFFEDPFEYEALGKLIKASSFANDQSDTLPSIADGGLPLLKALKILRQRHSTDPRDKVFATLGFVSQRERDLVAVDYNLSVLNVFINAAIVILESTGQLDFLSACEPVFPGCDLPSWVPDWSNTRTEAHVLIGLTQLAPFSAGGRGPVRAMADAKNRILRLDGKLLERINFKLPLDGVGGEIGLVVLFILVLICVALHNRADLGIGFTRHFIHTLSVGLVSDRGRTRMREQIETHRVADWIESTQVVKRVRNDIIQMAGNSSQLSEYLTTTHHKYGKDVPDREEFRGEPEKFHQGVEEWYLSCGFVRSSRALFVTESNRLALGGIGARRGDSIFIPAGGQVLLVVRLSDSGFYQFMGECFVQGMMSGQGLRDISEEEMDTITLH